MNNERAKELENALIKLDNQHLDMYNTLLQIEEAALRHSDYGFNSALQCIAQIAKEAIDRNKIED